MCQCACGNNAKRRKYTMPVKKEGDIISISEMHFGKLCLNIVGTSPLLLHAMSAKARNESLMPARKKNAIERASSLKHDPYQEFHDAAYKFRDGDNAATRLYFPASGFRKCIASAALDMQGARKSQIARLTNVSSEYHNAVPIYGVPQIYCFNVRNSDIKRTPDIRTLPLIEHWAAILEITYAAVLDAQSLVNLAASGGMLIGVGDGRPEKGHMSYGCFRIAADDDPELLEIMAKGKRKAQDAALANPQPYDLETERLLDWFKNEQTRRVATPSVAVRKPKIPTPTDEDMVPPAKRNNGRSKGQNKEVR
jgi:hypothetical protein